MGQVLDPFFFPSATSKVADGHHQVSDMGAEFFSDRDDVFPASVFNHVVEDSGNGDIFTTAVLHGHGRDSKRV